MATTVDNYKIKVTVEGREGLKNLKKDMEDLGSYSGPLGNSINSIISRLGPLGVAAGVAGVAFAGLGGRALTLAGELSDIAGATGIATGTLMNFRQSVVEAGGKAEDFGQIAAKLNQSVQEANSGNEKFQESFRNLGVYVTDANGKLRPTEAILQDIVAKFQSGELTSTQYAAAIDILGKNINKLELQKLRAAADPEFTKKTTEIDKYNEAIDTMTEKFNRLAITIAGTVAEAFNKLSNAMSAYDDKIVKAEQALNERGLTSRVASLPGQPLQQPIGATGLPDFLQRRLTEEEKAFLQRRKEEERMAKLMAPYKSRAGVGRDSGGFGETIPESILKAREASAKRIQDSINEMERQGLLKANSERLNTIMLFADKRSAIEQKAEAQIRDLRINSDSEITKAKLDIFAQEKLSKEEKERELAQKTLEINAKLATDIAKIRGQADEQLRAEDERIKDIITQSKARVEEETAVNDVIARRNKFFMDNLSMTDKERQRAQELFDLEEERLKVLRQIALIKDIPPEERLQREQEINEIFAKRRTLTEQQQSADRALQENFNAGFIRAYRQYVEDSQNAFEQAGRIFQSVTASFEDNLTKSLAKGKLLYKEFFLDVVQQLIRSNIQTLIGQVFGGVAGASRLNTTTNIFKSLLGFANGGIIPTNNPVVVGERGPELLVGAAGNRVIPNNQLGGSNVTYNINAVDAMSFKSMLAADPTFLYAVTEQGRRRLPGVA